MLIKNLTKSYGSTPVFKNFNLEIAEGAVTCILGGSGAGKTTLLNVIAGLTAFSGEVASVKCSYIFQEPRLVPNLTVYGNLRLVCRDDGAIRDMLEKTGLTQKESSYPIALSGGQAQRVSVARAFLYKSDVVLMDEPFSSLDLKLKISMMRVFGEVRANDGRTAVFVTHDIDEALYLADRIIVLSGGKIVFDNINERNLPFGADSPLRQKLIGVLTS